MKFRMSRTLADGPNFQLIGSRDAGLRIGSGDMRRALSRISAMRERGRDASIFSRITRSSSATLAASWRLEGSYSLARLNSRKAASSSPLASNSLPAKAWISAASILARSSAMRYSGLSGSSCTACR